MRQIDLFDGETPLGRPILSVTELTKRIKGMLESTFSTIQVRGEISNLRRQASGHAYFSLKDSGSQLACVLFRNDAAKCKATLADGAAVVAEGRISVYEPRGTHQMICLRVIPEGIGPLQARFERLRLKLEAEGLFDRSKKPTLPMLARRVGFATSPSGAALKDFVSILRRLSWPGEILVIPALVQGTNAAPDIVRAIRRAQDMELDLLVVGRGGGSLEDLWCFNEESVARAVAASRIPVISAVGHEIDFSLSDFAASVRAETPSSAAEMLANQFSLQRDRLQRLSKSLSTCAAMRFSAATNSVEMLRHRLNSFHPRRAFETAAQRLDDCAMRIRRPVLIRQRHERQNLERLAKSLSIRILRNRLENARQTTTAHEQRLGKATLQQVRRQKERLEFLEKRLANAGFEAVIERGFTIVRRPGEPWMTSGSNLAIGDPLEIRFKDALVTAEVCSVEPAT